jgi:hypothetical protein
VVAAAVRHRFGLHKSCVQPCRLGNGYQPFSMETPNPTNPVSTARREEAGGGGAGAARDRLRDPGTARGAAVAMRVAQMRGLSFYDTTVRMWRVV